MSPASPAVLWCRGLEGGRTQMTSAGGPDKEGAVRESIPILELKDTRIAVKMRWAR